MSCNETEPLLPTLAAKPRSNAAFGYFLMLFSAIFQALATLLFHMAEVEYHLPAPSSLLMLGSITFIIPLFAMTVRGDLVAAFSGARRKAVPLALRGLFGGCATMFSMLSVLYVSAGMFSVLFGLAPIFAYSLAAVLFGDPFTLAHVWSLLINIVGVALVSYKGPGSIASAVPIMHNTLSNIPPTPSSSSTSVAVAAATASAHPIFGFIAGLLAALCAACAALSIKRVGKGVDNHVVTAMFGTGCLAFAPVVARSSDVAVLLAGGPGVWCGLAGSLSGFLTQLFFALSLRHAPAGPAVLVRSLAVPIVFALALIFMNEAVSAVNLLGVVLTVASLAPLYEKKHQTSGATEGITKTSRIYAQATDVREITQCK